MRLLTTLLALAAALPLQAQTIHHVLPHSTNIGVGAWRNADSTRSASVNIGLWSQTDTLHGVQAGLLDAGVARQSAGVNIGGLTARTLGPLDGVQVAGVSNIVAGQLRGLQIGGTNAALGVRGAQIGLLSNTSGAIRGTQLALTNIARGVKGGVQAGGLNITSGDMRGLQAGVYNYADTLCGLQAGIINVNAQNPKGFQLGLVNISADTHGRRVGLVNVNPDTRMQFMAYGGNYDKLSFGVRFRNRSTYNILALGSFHTGLGTERYSAAVGYRIGQFFHITPRLSVSGDLGVEHIETFREETATRPERLYSFQGRVNVDYQLSRYLGAFVSGGYGHTRWYSHHRKFRDKPILEGGLTVDFEPQTAYGRRTRSERARAAATTFEEEHGDSASAMRDALFAYNLACNRVRHPWWAAAEVAGINVFVQTFDRFVLCESYSKINPSTLARNFRNGFVWDNDYFSTNQFAHPYHGNLYFNAARTNGMNFWQSFPYALGGSLMWEFWGETDPPAINDVFSTSMGGAAIGEVFFRTSALVLDDSKRGWPRVWREVVGGLLNPIRGLNRLLSGDAWRVRGDHHLYHDYNRIPVDASIIIGERYVADEGHMARGSHNLRLGFHLEYGDAFADEATKPYDYFSADLRFNFGGQPLVSDIHLVGRLYGKSIYEGKAFRTQWGVFQHFDYYASDSIKGSDMKNPFEISQTAAFGPGFIMQMSAVGNLKLLEQRLFVNGILLGGSKSDYYNFLDRDYNIGSGFGWKTITRLEFKRFGNFTINMEYYRLWTWKGFEGKNYKDPGFDAHFLNAQGDKSNAQLLVVSPRYEFYVAGGWNLLLNSAFYNRITQYHYHKNKHSHTYEITIGATYHF